MEKVGGLPPNVRARARAIKRKNPSWPLSRCIATAINANKHAVATGGDLHFKGRQQEGPKALARHTKATAEWEAKKARSGSLKKRKKRGVNLADSKEETSPTVTVAANKKKKKSKKGSKADVGSSKAKLRKAIKEFKAKGGDPKGKEAARLKSSKQRLGEKGKLNMSEAVFTDGAGNFLTINLAQTGSGNTNTKLDKKSRKKYAEKGNALPDGSFPINNKTDLKNAKQSIGRTNPKKRKKVRELIKKRKQELGGTDQSKVTDANPKNTKKRKSGVRKGSGSPLT